MSRGGFILEIIRLCGEAFEAACRLKPGCDDYFNMHTTKSRLMPLSADGH